MTGDTVTVDEDGYYVILGRKRFLSPLIHIVFSFIEYFDLYGLTSLNKAPP